MSESGGLTVLVVDDEEIDLRAMERILKGARYQVHASADPIRALEILREQPADVILTDLVMPTMAGEAFVKRCKEIRAEAEVIVISGKGCIERAVEVMRLGAHDFLEKPIEKYQLLKSMANAAETRKLKLRVQELEKQIGNQAHSEEMLGASENFKRVKELAAQVASSDVPILIRGESGTGKEILADFIRRLSPRKEGPFVKMNCSAVPEHLLESELFGYEKGAFTGASSAKAGRLECAHKGTLFLDEVGEMSPVLQTKLLRVLENGEFERLGSTKTLKTEFRILAATHADLEQRILEKSFRQDLYYRLNGVEIFLPPLRDRRSDIPIFCSHFLERANKKNGKKIAGFDTEVMQRLENHLWPGNIRELQNAIERAVVTAKTSLIGLHDLPPSILRGFPDESSFKLPLGTSLKALEQRMIEETLRLTGGNKEKAAEILQISSRTLHRRVKENKDKLS